MPFIVAEYDIGSYADNNTPYFGGGTIENVMLHLENFIEKNFFSGFILTK